MHVDEIRAEIVGRNYFMSGPFLEALESTDRVVLLIDELVRLTMLLRRLS